MAYQDQNEEVYGDDKFYVDEFGERITNSNDASEAPSTSSDSSMLDEDDSESLIADESTDDDAMADEPTFRESLSSDSAATDPMDEPADASEEAQMNEPGATHQGFGEKIREKFNDLTGDDSDRSV